MANISGAEGKRRLGSLLAFQVPREFVLSTLIWISPLLFATFAIKAYKVALWFPILSNVRWASVPGRALPAVISVILGALVIAGCIEGARRFRLPMSALILSPVGLFVICWLAMWYSGHGADLKGRLFAAVETASLAFQVCAADLLFSALALGAALIVRRAFERWSGKGIAAHRSIWMLAVPLLLLALELAYYKKTGIAGTAQMLGFAFTNASSIWFLVRGEADPTVAVAIVLSALTLFGASRILKSRTARSESAPTRSESAPARSTPNMLLAPTLFVTLAFCTAFSAPPNDLRYARFSSNLFLTLVHDLTWARFLGLDPAQIRDAAFKRPPLFDTGLGAALDGEHAPRVNVVLVMIESARTDSTTIHSPALSSTPFLAEIAHQGIVVDDMYAAVPRTSAAWVSILQGVFPGDNTTLQAWGLKNQEHPISVALPGLLRPFGYASAFFTPTHLKLENEMQIVKNFGFDEVVSDDGVLAGDGFERVGYFGLEDRALLAPIGKWVAQQAEGQHPFLLTVMTHVGHWGYETPSTHPSKSYPIPADMVDKGGYQAYLNCLGYVDSFLHDLLHAVEGAGAKDTLYVFVGDHGESFGEHGARQHLGLLYEETLRVPAVLFAPGRLPGGQHIGGRRQQIDILPTVLELLGLRLTAGRLPGESLLTARKGDDLYFNGYYEDSVLGLVRQNKKYIFNFHRSPMEVYDLVADPTERHNLGPSLADGALVDVERDLLVWRESVRMGLGL